MRKKISIAASCFNEEENIPLLHERIVEVFKKHPQYDYEIIVIDNASTDRTAEVMTEIAKKDKNFKCLFNVRDFGHIRSPYYAVLQTTGDAVVQMASDLEDPPELISEFIQKWEEGNKIVIGRHASRDQSWLLKVVRSTYYLIIDNLSEVKQIRNFAGFCLYDREVIEKIREINDPYPYLRGLICQLGYKRAELEFHKPLRKYGLSKGSFLIYFDMAMLAIVSQSQLPLRLATLAGGLMCVVSFCAAFLFLIYKLLFWYSFQVGIAPLIILGFFLFGVLFLILGIIGEYLSYLIPRVSRRPIVVLERKLNFDDNETTGSQERPQFINQ